jgi:hypothetical protein
MQSDGGAIGPNRPVMTCQEGEFLYAARIKVTIISKKTERVSKKVN